MQLMYGYELACAGGCVEISRLAQMGRSISGRKEVHISEDYLNEGSFKAGNGHLQKALSLKRRLVRLKTLHVPTTLHL